MKSLFKHLREMAKRKSSSIYKKSIQSRNYISSIGLILWASSCLSLPAYAEGSRNMYPNGALGDRGSILWTNTTWGGNQKFNERTLLRVFAKQGEYILMGSSAVNVGDGNILVYGTISGDASKENLPGTADFSCKAQGGGSGKINTRAEELAGPQSVNGNNNKNGYKPCFYKAPTTGIYYIAMYGPSGGNSDGSGSANPNNGIKNNQTIGTINIGTDQNTSISAWDVTVRSSDQSSITDFTGRLFTMLIAMNMGDNGKKLNSTLYPVTVDGYRYKVTMRGLDPFGFRIFGNQIGNLDSDGKTPLYRDVLGSDGNIATPEGGTSTAPPQFPIFFNLPSNDALNQVTRYSTEGKNVGNGIPLVPIAPEVTNPNFQGSNSGNTSTVNTGGKFSFNTNVPANYQIIISRDGINFDPTNPQNRVLRGSIPIPGQQTVTWSGKDNSAQPFPVGNNYPYKVQIQSGEYHFPLSDAENNVSGGPTIELLNTTNSLGNFTAFYDDRMYTTIDGIQVKGDQTYDPNKALCGVNPPNPPFSDPIKGGDSRSSTFRSFGSNTGGNTNSKCTGSFGDTKTLDTWIYVPSQAKQAQLNIVAPSVKVSGTVYEDFGTGGANNNNNTFDSGEKTIGKVTVNLFKDDNNDGQPDGAAVKTIETNATGAYQFTDVAPGRYVIQVDTRDTDIPSTYAIGTPNPIKINVSADLTNQNFGFNTVSKTCPAGSFLPEQTFLNFQNPTAEPGTTNGNYNVGAVYRFSNVAADIDALVEIKSLNNATLTQIDVNNFGVPSAFQPEVRANSQNAGNYSVDFDIRFVQSGTTTPVELRKVLATGIDIDGDTVRVREASELGGNQFTSYAIDSNSRLTATKLSATRIKFESTTTFNLDGIAINPSNQGSAFYDKNTQSIDYRAGLIIDPGSGQNVANQRLTSLVFDCVQYNLAVTSNPNVILVKRITAINGNRNQNPNDGTTLNQFVDDTTSSQQNNDNSPKWPDNYLLGAIDAGKVRREDEIEYTVYFLNIGNSDASNVRLCDRITANQDFQPNTYAAGRGIQLKLGNSAQTNLTNANDSVDRAQLITPGGAVPANCNLKGGNTKGTVQIDITGNTGSPPLTTMPGSTGKGTPNNSYGLFRFTTKVQP